MRQRQAGPQPRAVAEPGVKASKAKTNTRKALPLTSDCNRVQSEPQRIATPLGFYRPPLTPWAHSFSIFGKRMSDTTS